jgi:uncharacterized membrane protein
MNKTFSIISVGIPAWLGLKKRRSSTDSVLRVLGGIGLGAGLMYILDPARGNRRRAIFKDKVVSGLNKTGDAIGTTSRDLGHRTYGLFSSIGSLFSRGEVSDEKLVARVRSKLGRVVSHPHAIEVIVNEGRVTLSGAILADEVDDLLEVVSSVGGVVDIVNRLEVHNEAGDHPDLQGGVDRPGESFELLQTNWSPAIRVLASAAGGTLAFYGFKRKDPIGIALGILGSGFALRAITNKEVTRLVGVGGRSAVDIQKTININAPVDEVYRFWTNYANFPKFMTNVQEVRESGQGQSHWVVNGPAGTTVEWDAIITRKIDNRIFAWKTLPGQIIANAGIIHFEPVGEDGTRLHIQLTYNPPGGALGHTVSSILGANPKRQIEEDLVRMKTLLETGKIPRDAAQKGDQDTTIAKGKSAQ